MQYLEKITFSYSMAGTLKNHLNACQQWARTIGKFGLGETRTKDKQMNDLDVYIIENYTTVDVYVIKLHNLIKFILSNIII